MGPIPIPDLRPIFVLAVVGLIAILGFGMYGLWWLFSNLQWVG